MDGLNTSTADQIDDLVRRASGITIDSRTARKNELFFAIAGENFDGNRFAPQALAAGCLAAVVSDRGLAATDERYVWVEDGLQAMQEAANRRRMRWSCPVVALTGSNGKTTTKELIRDVLASEKCVAATEGNFNNEIGVPLTILRMPDDLDIAVLEMGANAQGEIRRLVQIAEPTHALITNIGSAHLEGFGGPEGVKKGKSEIYIRMRDSGAGMAFVNALHPVLVEVSEGLERVLYGAEGEAPAVRRAGHRHDAFEWWDGQVWRGPFPTSLQGDHNLENIATALAVGMHFQITPEAAEQAIARYQPTNNRSEWRETGNNQVLLDAYNANPSSMVATLTYFAEALASKPDLNGVLIVLGEMGELGPYSAEGHAEVAEAAIELATELPGLVVMVGTPWSAALQTLQAPENVVCCANSADAAKLISELRPQGQTVLLKGSRSVALENLLPLL